MKLLTEDNKFEFIKNGQVVIDKDLPKYVILAEVEARKKRESVEAQKREEEESIMGTDNNEYPVLSSTITEHNLDNEYRKSLHECGYTTVKEYLGKEDAKEFNERFFAILNGEVRHNSYSTAVYSSNIIAYDEPIKKNAKKKKPSLLSKLKEVFKKHQEEKSEERSAQTLLDFFEFIHVEGGKEKEFVDKLKVYFEMLDKAIKMGQTAQTDAICQNLIQNIYESVLAVHGYNRFIPFTELQNCKIAGKRVVDIDYIKNFGRDIPQEVVDKKLECDNLCIFDNYCVMYYDPSGATYKVPEKSKRDPILFGLINHSEKLYYIADWEDEYCDLTLDKLAEKLSVEEID